MMCIPCGPKLLRQQLQLHSCELPTARPSDCRDDKVLKEFEEHGLSRKVATYILYADPYYSYMVYFVTFVLYFLKVLLAQDVKIVSCKLAESLPDLSQLP